MRGLQTQLDEAGSGEVAVEGQGFTNREAAHQGEARRIDEGVLALIVTPQTD